jgi:hypothetical protein
VNRPAKRSTAEHGKVTWEESLRPIFGSLLAVSIEETKQGRKMITAAVLAKRSKMVQVSYL